jgi:peptidoglycan/LPS O-acetylase OafA/YrhL
MKVLGASRLQVAITLAAAVALLLLVYGGVAHADPADVGKNIGKWGTGQVQPLWKFGAGAMAAVLMFARRAARMMEHGVTALYTGAFVLATPAMITVIKGIGQKFAGQ